MKRVKKAKKTEKPERAKKRRKPVILLCICAVIVITAVINILVVKTSAPYILSAGEAAERGTVDCILVLGASVTEYGPSLMLSDRLDKGLELFGLGVSNILLLSGDNGQVEYNEVQAMKDYVLQYGGEVGLGADNIYLDYAGFSTYDSVVRCKEVFGAEKIVIVTQRYHLYRAVFNAKRIGLDVVGVAAQDTNRGQFSRDLREVPARVKDFFLTLIGAKPKYLGDPVPLVYPSTQSGQVQTQSPGDL